MRNPPVVPAPPPVRTRTVASTRGRHGRSSHSRPHPAEYVTPPVEFAYPWICALLVAAAGLAAHAALGRRLPDAAWGTAAVLAGTAALTGLAWGYSHAREAILRWHTTTVTALSGLAVMVSLIVGPARPWLWAEGLLFAFVAASWNLRRLDVVRGEGHDIHTQAAKSGLDDLIGLPGAKARVRSVDGPRREVEVQTAGGQDYSDVQKAAARVNALAHLPPNSVRAVADPDDSSKARMVMVTEDVLKHMLPWPGPSAPGGSIALPLRHGLYEDGLPAQLWLCGNWTPTRGRDVEPRNGVHLLIMGISGAGKTITALILAVEILTRADAVMIWVDVVKGAQSAGPVKDAVASFVNDRAAAKQLFVGLRRAVEYRAQWLGERGFREWWPGCGIPFLVVWVEEASQAIPDSDVVTRLTEACRSVGISLVLSMQRASADNIPSSARSNMGAAMCFGVNEKTGGQSDAQFALSEETIAAGARPEAWGTSKPGYHYLEAPGVPADRWSMKARSFYEDDGPLQAAVAAYAHLRPQLDAGTAAAIGDVFEAGRPGRTPAATTAGDVMPRPDDYEDDLPDDDGDGEWVVPPQPEPDLAERIDPRAPIPEWIGPDIDLGPADDGRPPMSPDDRMAAFKNILVGFLERGQEEVQMGELVDAWQAQLGPFAANQRPHLHAMLNALIELGQVERAASGRGRYRLCLLVSASNGHRP